MIRGVSASLSGFSGRVRYGYKVAADVGAWRLKLAPRLPRCYDLTAELTEPPGYWLTKRPLTLMLDVAGASWEWHGVDLAVNGTTVTASGLGVPSIVQWARVQGG